MLDNRASKLLSQLLSMDLHVEPPDDVAPAQGFMHRSPTQSIYFFGKGLDLLRELQRHTSRDIMSDDGGISPEAIAHLVATTYRRQEAEGKQDAVRWLRSELARPNPWWTVHLGMDDLLPPARDLDIAGCTLHGGAPAGVGDLAELDYFQREHPAPMLATQVRARDAETARLVADARADSVRGLLALGMSRPDRSRSRHVTIPGLIPYEADGGSAHFGPSRTARLSAALICDRDGRLWPGVRELSDAAAHPRDERSDWAQRTLNASRWYFEYMTTNWHTQALIAAMNVFECLLLRDMRVTPKGTKLAAAVTRIAPERNLDPHAQRQWLGDLYTLRSRAVHEGLSITEDLQVEDLFGLVSRTLWWAVEHLNPMHRDDGLGCSTFEEVHHRADLHVAV